MLRSRQPGKTRDGGGRASGEEEREVRRSELHDKANRQDNLVDQDMQVIGDERRWLRQQSRDMEDVFRNGFRIKRVERRELRYSLHVAKYRGERGHDIVGPAQWMIAAQYSRVPVKTRCRCPVDECSGLAISGRRVDERERRPERGGRSRLKSRPHNRFAVRNRWRRQPRAKPNLGNIWPMRCQRLTGHGSVLVIHRWSQSVVR